MTVATLQNLLSAKRKKSLAYKNCLLREWLLQLKANSVEKASILKALNFLILKVPDVN